MLSCQHVRYKIQSPSNNAQELFTNMVLYKYVSKFANFVYFVLRTEKPHQKMAEIQRKW